MRTFFKYLITASLIIVFILISRHANAAETPLSVIVQYQGGSTEKINVTDVNTYWSLMQNLSRRPGVKYVGENHLFSMAVSPNDTLYSSQWYLPFIGLPTTWDTITGSRNVVVAVLDSGVDIAHPDLSSNIWNNSDEIPGNGIDDDKNGFIDDANGWDFVSNSSDPRPKFDAGWSATGINHGTVVSGIVGALGNNNIGISGVNWQVSIMPLRVLNGAGIGDTHTIYEAVQYAIANGADFINLSFVGDEDDLLLSQAINVAYNQGIITFAAAGNEGLNLNNTPRYPACDKNVITIGGTDENDQRVIFYNGNGVANGGSNYGSACLSMVAPADNFTSTGFYDPSHDLSNYYLSSWYGTSFATPLVTGAAALLKAWKPELTGQQIVTMLRENSIDIDLKNPAVSGQLGSGRLSLDNIFQSNIPSVGTYNISVGTMVGGAPQVRILSDIGQLQSQFFAYPSSDRYGVRMASADFQHDGSVELITSEGKGGMPLVRIQSTDGITQNQFYAYATTFRGGVTVAAGDVNGDGTDEIITGAGSGGGPHVRVFDRNGAVLSQFFGYATDFKKGIEVNVVKNR